jgi:hypothetical protein
VAKYVAEQVEPTNCFAWMTLGRVYELQATGKQGSDKDDLDAKAKSCYRRAVRLNPRDPLMRKLERNMDRSLAQKYHLENRVPRL